MYARIPETEENNEKKRDIERKSETIQSCEHISDNSTHWPKEITELCDQDLRMAWFSPGLIHYSTLKEYMFYIFIVLNTYFLRRYATPDGRLPNEHKLLYVNYLYKEKYSWSTCSTLRKQLHQPCLMWDGHCIDLVKCWEGWYRIIHFPHAADYSLKENGNISIIVRNDYVPSPVTSDDMNLLKYVDLDSDNHLFRVSQYRSQTKDKTISSNESPKKKNTYEKEEKCKTSPHKKKKRKKKKNKKTKMQKSSEPVQTRESFDSSANLFTFTVTRSHILYVAIFALFALQMIFILVLLTRTDSSNANK